MDQQASNTEQDFLHRTWHHQEELPNEIKYFSELVELQTINKKIKPEAIYSPSE